jgi:hypothetical protein
MRVSSIRRIGSVSALRGRTLPAPDILVFVVFRRNIKGFLALALLLPLLLVACHKEEQAVEGVAQNAVNAEKKAQASATVLDQERAELEQIPLPTKSLYVDVHEPAQWANPFLSVGPDMITLRILNGEPNTPDENPVLRPEAARRQVLQLRPSDLGQAIAAIPPAAWHYGRVVAIAESPTTTPADRLKVRRNVEFALKQLNDLGVVVEEWPSR